MEEIAISVKVPVDTHKRLKELADKTHRSMAGLIRLAIDNEIQYREDQQPKADVNE